MNEIQFFNVIDILIDETLNPRKRRDAKADAELLGSIKHRAETLGEENALIEPLTVTMRDGNVPLLANGERRLSAAFGAGLKQVPCLIRDLTVEQIYDLRLLDDLMKGVLHPLDESDAYNQLNIKHADGALTTAEIAIRFGKNEDHVARRLKLQEISPAIRKAYESGTVGVDSAEVLAIYPQKIQDKALHDVLLRTTFTGYDGKENIMPVPTAELKRWLRENALLDLTAVAFSKTDATLNQKMGACTACPHRTEALATLFGDLPGSMCTLAECYNSKRKEFAKRELEKAQKKYAGATPILVSAEYGKTKKGVKAPYEWDRCEENAKGAVLVQLINGKEGGKVVWGKIKTSAVSNQKSDPTETEKVAAEKRDQEQAIASIYRNLLLEAVAKKCPTKLTHPEDIRAVALNTNHSDDDLPELLGFKPGKSIEAQPLDKVVRLIIMSSYGSPYSSLNLETLAKRLKVDTKKLRAEAKREHESLNKETEKVK